MRPWTAVWGILLIALASSHVQAQTARGTPMPPAPAVNPAFEQIKTLAGEWEGTSSGRPVRTSFHVVANGSAVLNMLEPSGEPEMVSVFHLDGPALMVTHYCSAGNQPRMVARASYDPTLISFRFKDITNLSSPTAGHMRQVVLKVTDADHHRQEWTFRQDGKYHTAVFEFTRKK